MASFGHRRVERWQERGAFRSRQAGQIEAQLVAGQHDGYTLKGCWVTKRRDRPRVNRFGTCVGGISALMRAWNLA